MGVTEIYTVCSAYKLLDKDSRDENLDGAFKDIWKLKIPIQNCFICLDINTGQTAHQVQICVGGMLTLMTNCAHSVETRKRRQLIYFSAVLKFNRFGGNHCLG